MEISFKSRIRTDKRPPLSHSIQMKIFSVVMTPKTLHISTLSSPLAEEASEEAAEAPEEAAEAPEEAAEAAGVVEAVEAVEAVNAMEAEEEKQ